jgi:hypothetical protein
VLEDYSNNVGLYGVHTQFSIVPAVSRLPGSGAPTETGTLGTVAVDAPRLAHLDDDVYLKVHFSANGGSVKSLTVVYYDGELGKGELIDTQIIHHIEADGSYTHGTLFQPTSCRTHNILVQASSAQGSSVTSRAASIKVTVDPINVIDDMSTRISRLKMPAVYARTLQLNLTSA